MSETTNLGLPYLASGQAMKHVTHNEALRRLDGIVQLAVTDRQTATPPLAPEEGARWLIAADPTDDWSGKADEIAAWQDGAWAYLVPQEGWLCWISDEETLLAYTADGWVSATATELQLQTLGINATADTTNRLAAAAQSILLTAETDDLHVTLNKSGSASSAGMLFQSDYDGHAEIGLLGDNDLSIKLSKDGDSFIEAIRITLTPDDEPQMLLGSDSALDSSSTCELHSGDTALLANMTDANGGKALAISHQGTDRGGLSVDAAGDISLESTGALHINHGIGILLLKANGGVDINNASSNGMLSVRGIAGSRTTQFIQGADTVSERTILSQSTNGNNFGAYVDAQARRHLTNNSTEVLSVANNGDMGVGTKSPSTRLHVNGPVRCATYSVSTAPDPAATGAGAMIFVDDDSNGYVMAFSDGTSWRRVTDRQIISA